MQINRYRIRFDDLRTLALGSLSLLCLPSSSLAQASLPPSIDAGAIQRRSMELEQQLHNEQEPAILQPIEKPAPPDASKAQLPVEKFHLKRIRFSPSEILKEEELAALAQEFEGKEVSKADLQALLNKINLRYRELGIITAQAVLPPQDVVDGVINIRLIEGHIGKILLKETQDTRGDYVKAWVKQAPGALPDISELERDLLRFNRTNDAQLSAELQPGTKFGESDVILKLVEPQKHDLRLFADNMGSYSTGEVRAGVMYQNSSLLGLRDALGLNYTHAAGHNGYGLGYALPINTWGTRLAGAYNLDKTLIRYGPFRDLHITGEAESYGVDIRHPLYFDSKSYLEGSAGLRKRQVTSWISGTLLQEMSTRDKHLGLDWQTVDSAGFWSASLSYVSGNADFSGGKGTHYALTRGTLRRVQNLGDGWSIQGKVSFQATRDVLLPSSEQFLIGGEGTVRGYQTGLYSGDTGRVVSAELHHPLPFSFSNAKLSGYFFVDHGITKPYRPVGSNLGADEINGAGYGLNLTVGKQISAKVSLGLPLRERPEEKRNYYITAQVMVAVF